MKKVLVIGEAGATTKELISKLGECFEVLDCKTDINVINVTVMTSKPDLLAVNLLDAKAAEMLLFQLKSSFTQPIACICRLSDSQKYLSYIDNNHIRACFSDAVDTSMVKLCCKCLGLDYTTVLLENQSLYQYVKKTVLLIDDSSIFLRQGKSMLEEDYNVLIAPSAEKGIELLEKNIVDLILLDYEMPGVDGKECFERIKRLPDKSRVPIIFLTGVSDREHIAQVLQLKPNGYILKPVTKDSLLQRIQPAFK